MTRVALAGPLRTGEPALANPRAFVTPRQREVLVLMANGLTNRAIGRRLGVDEQTIKTTVRRILRQLHVDDRAQAATVAIRIGLLSADDIDIPRALRHLNFDPRRTHEHQTRTDAQSARDTTPDLHGQRRHLRDRRQDP